MQKTALILGASGRFGRHAAIAFETAGWQVRKFTRGDDLNAAAMGADVIVNAWNPPYSQWAKVVPGFTAQVIEAARRSGATVIIPGNVYVYGHGMPGLIGPGVPHRAENPLGKIRCDLEAAYRDAGVRTIILRGGDFIDTETSGNWFDMIMAKSIAKGRFVYPGRPDIPHAWAYLPDMAKAAVALADRRDALPRFADFAFEGFTLTGQELSDACAAALGRDVLLKQMMWLPIQLARPFWTEARHILEMRYLWNTPHALDGSVLAQTLPGMVTTAPVAALAKALAPLVGQKDVHPYQAMA